MARKADTPCAGGCGKLLWGGMTSLPAGQRMCRSCRSCRPRQRRPTTRRPADVRSAACPACGVEFTFDANHGPVRRYCKKACKERAAARRRRAPLVAARAAARAATKAAKPRPASRIKTCAECGTEYVGQGAAFCTPGCAKRGAWRKNLARYGTTPEEAEARCCRNCGGAKPLRAHLCEPCREATEREAKRRARRTRKARQRGAISEPYTLAEIAARDRHRCGLCRKSVAMKQVVPHPKSPTIDHVLPLVDGGDDVRSNVQLAHFICNSIKSAGGTQQLALIG
jgi:hypothetical protein